MKLKRKLKSHRSEDKEYDRRMMETMLHKYPALTDADGNLMEEYLLGTVYTRAFVSVITLNEDDLDIWRTVIVDITQMMRGRSFDEICLSCRELYGGENSDNQKKRTAAQKILNDAAFEVDGDSEHESLFARFDTVCNIVDYKPDKLKKMYLQKYLPELKYCIREKEKHFEMLRGMILESMKN